jgi:N-acetylglutamate synthase-like GNAT family acetyltransferase
MRILENSNKITRDELFVKKGKATRPGVNTMPVADAISEIKGVFALTDEDVIKIKQSLRVDELMQRQGREQLLAYLLAAARKSGIILVKRD